MSDRANVRVLEDPTAVLFEAGTSGARVLSATDDGRRNLRFEVIDRTGSPFDAGVTTFEPDLERMLGDLWSFLAGAAEEDYGAGERRESFLTRLRGLGVLLFDRLLPGDLRREIRAWPDAGLIQITSNESWLPWELLHDGGGFMTERFKLVRLPRRPLGAGSPPIAARVSPAPGRVLHVVGEALLAAHKQQSEAPFQGLEASRYVPLFGPVLSQVTDAAADADVVHFSCGCDKRGLEMRHQDPLGALDAVSLATAKLKPGAVVFANACRMDGAPATAQLLPLGPAFYARGAVVYVGALSPLPPSFALEFARYFYRELLDDGHDALEAFWRVREMAGLGPIRLLYSFCGNPRFVASGRFLAGSGSELSGISDRSKREWEAQ